jgi:hypothetical protein
MQVRRVAQSMISRLMSVRATLASLLSATFTLTWQYPCIPHGAGAGIAAVAAGLVHLSVNTTSFTDGTAGGWDGGAIYFDSTDSDSSLLIKEVTFTNNVGSGYSANDVYSNSLDFTCTVSSGSGVVSGNVGGTCVIATPAPTTVRQTSPHMVQ